ncbi:ABC-1 domain-containing protein [[Leptolyngbya] sp. PCC 7376]|uniref:ABC1 kinase family protein n=1 Tax=[Leptolyngbya] sp. PCC 7376 TaxID=111781 RepID=UPI00029F2CDE|nr:AarF/ABC1/UbiB kinase family protein [[Leptolyngbya] sp. PCC 7376]AFY38356.1 ABC-1 domain-containing protein [[Leptolyngbya] sp. PCC 7376]
MPEQTQTPETTTSPVTMVDSEDWRYNPEKVDKLAKEKPFAVFGRLSTIVTSFVGLAIHVWWDSFRGKTKSPQAQKSQANHLKQILTDLGPTYIKIGQALSTRPDLVPPTYLAELTDLQDQLPSFPTAIAFKFIEEELGRPPEEIYAEISPEPLAAASLGQVYQARLKTGEKVAVKVQRPDLENRINLDIAIMRKIARWLQTNVKRVRSDLIGITDEFAGRIFEEMNYSQEGRNAERFKKYYGGMEEIYVPSIYWDYTGRRVLTMEWLDGIKLTNLKEIAALGIDATHLVEVGVECSLRQLLEHGFFHADPHPGNLLALEDGRLAYLDFGMMSTIKPYQRYGLIEAVVHLVNRDFDSLAHDYVKLDFLTPDTDLTPIIPALSTVFGNALGASVAELNFKSITDQMSGIMYEFPFQVPAYYALIIRSMVTLEGIAIGVDPEFKVLSKAYPYVAKRLLTDESEELRNSLKDLLFKDGSFRWNRLENLLQNAKTSQDYDLEGAVNQAVDYIFSERGDYIREQLASEIVQSVDAFGLNTLQNFTNLVQQRFGQKDTPARSKTVNVKDNAANLEHIQTIWQILQDTPNFDPTFLLPLVPRVLMKRETQQLGQKIAEGLLQKVAARFIRNVLLADNKPATEPKTVNADVIRYPSTISAPKAALR